MLNFAGRVALITGAGNGLGASYARWFAARGAKVLVNNRLRPGQPSSARAIVAEITAAGGQAFSDEHDVADAASGEAMVEAAIRQFGHLDIVVANAGCSNNSSVSEVNLQQFHDIMNVNFFGSIGPVLAALPMMRARGYGRVVLTVSAAGLFGAMNRTAYAASKMALIGFMRAASIELGRENVRINAVSPYARTNMSRDVLSENMEEIMSPDKVAPVLGWLCSDQCNRSGIILSSGAGRVRRAAMVETAVAPLEAEPDVIDWATLDDLTRVIETRNSRRSSTELIPELLARTNP